jgi:hypothetical protein
MWKMAQNIIPCNAFHEPTMHLPKRCTMTLEELEVLMAKRHSMTVYTENLVHDLS